MKKHKTMINRILIPTDFSETGLLAVEHGAFMARVFKADLYLLHVIEGMEFTYNVYNPIVMIRDVSEMQEVVIQRLNDLSERIRKDYGISVNILTSSGRTASAIAEMAKAEKIDLVIMGTHGAKGFEEYFIGSNAHKTVTIASCPVITVQSHAQRLGFTNIVMPIDNSLHSRQKVDHVIELASHYASRVHILGLVVPDETDEKKFSIKLDTVEKAVHNAGISYVLKVIKGENLAVEAMKYSEKVKADLVVIMTDHESDLTGMFLGAFAKQIINHSRIPVMSIKPREGGYEGVDVSATSNPFT